MNNKYDCDFDDHEFEEDPDPNEGEAVDLDRTDEVSVDFEMEYVRVCRHYPECPFTPPPGDEDCPGCRANEQYLSEGPGLILASYLNIKS